MFYLKAYSSAPSLAAIRVKTADELAVDMKTLSTAARDAYSASGTALSGQNAWEVIVMLLALVNLREHHMYAIANDGTLMSSLIVRDMQSACIDTPICKRHVAFMVIVVALAFLDYLAERAPLNSDSADPLWDIMSVEEAKHLARLLPNIITALQYPIITNGGL
jgi:hypothetical protein